MRMHVSKYCALTAILLVAAGVKVWIILSGNVPFNSDEAVVALMARHILAGESPVFFYGQAYMGSLDAYFVSMGFAIFGEHVWVVRGVQAILYLATVGTTFFLGEQIFKSWKAGAIAGSLMAVPAVNTSLYTTVSLGGYGEAILLGNLTLLVTLRIAEHIHQLSLNNGIDRSKNTRIFWFGWFMVWGFLIGLGLWVFGLTLVYSIPAFLVLLWWVDKPQYRPKQVFFAGVIATAGVGILIGSEPWWAFALKHGLEGVIGELGGSAVAVEQSSFLMRTAGHTVNYFLLGIPALLGIRPPWEVRWLVLPVIPFVLLFWGSIAAWTVKKVYTRNTSIGLVLLIGVVSVQMVLFMVTYFGLDPSGRYFLPLAAPLAVLAGGYVTTTKSIHRKLAFAGLIVVVLYQFAGNFDCIRRYPPGLSTQFNYETTFDHTYIDELQTFLVQQGETRGYTNYWVAYPLAFLSKESLIFVPRLPYHQNMDYTERDDRYTSYTREVGSSERTAYITTGQPALEEQLRNSFEELGVSWDETTIGDFNVFYQISRPVHPNELRLGG